MPIKVEMTIVHGNLMSMSKGQCVIIIHAEGAHGFVPNSSLCGNLTR